MYSHNQKQDVPVVVELTADIPWNLNFPSYVFKATEYFHVCVFSSSMVLRVVL